MTVLSKDVAELREELLRAVGAHESGEQSLLHLTNSVTQSDVEAVILENISNENYQKAVQYMQQFR